MTLLAPEADRVVRDAVEAFLAAESPPSMAGEASFETRNSEYRLLDGVLYGSNDASIVGAELVGWLLEVPGASFVQETWVLGARAVMVDRKNSRNIIVTSTSRIFRTDAGSGLKQMPQAPAMPAGSYANHQGGSAAAQLRPAPTPTPVPSSSPTVTTDPLRGPSPLRQIPACPPLPIGRLPGTTELSVATQMITREPSQPGAPLPLPPPTAIARPASQGGFAERPSAPVHPPPRLAGRPRAGSIPQLSPPPQLRPLPYPKAPARRPAAASTRHDTLRDEEEELGVDDIVDETIEIEENPAMSHDRSELPLPPASSARPSRRSAPPAAAAVPRPSRRTITAN